MPVCMVKSCRYSWRKGDDTVKLHIFPRRPEMVRLWLTSIHVSPAEMEVLFPRVSNDRNNAYRICSKHFSRDAYEKRATYYFLKKDAVPTIDLGEPCAGPVLASSFEHNYSSFQLPQTPGQAIPADESYMESMDPTQLTLTTDTSEFYFDSAQTKLCCVEEVLSNVESDKEEEVVMNVDDTTSVSLLSTGLETQHNPLKRKKPYIRTRKTIGVNTEPRNVKHRSTTVQRSLLTQNVSIQCNLACLPPLEKLIKESHRTTIEKEVMPAEGQNKAIVIDPEDVDHSFVDDEDGGPCTRIDQETKYIVFESCLDRLLLQSRCQWQPGCNAQILSLQKRRVGSAISVSGLCERNHVCTLWQSQPLIGKMPAGNLLISAGTLLSGNNFLKMERFFFVTGILGIDSTAHYKNQNDYLFPAIDLVWQQKRVQVLPKTAEKPVALATDAQCEYRGSNAKYCVYSVMNLCNKQIIDFQVEQLKPGVSASLEENACKKVMQRLRNNNVNVCVLCTDRNASIRKLLRRDYPHIVHQIDVGQMSKSLGNKLLAASKMKNCAAIAPWISSAKNHLWWSSSTCRRDPEVLLKRWFSITHHVSNEHQWEDGGGYDACHHPPRERNKDEPSKWIKKGSEAYYKFLEVVADKRFLKDMRRLSNFCHAKELEVFHSTALMYRSKRKHFHMDAMIARTQLAVMDYNANISLPQAGVRKIGANSEEMGSLCYRSRCKELKEEQTVLERCDPKSLDFLLPILHVTFQIAFGEMAHSWKSRRKELAP